MQKINTYQAISNKEFLAGIQPLDLAVTVVSFCLLAFIVNFFIGIVVFIILYIFFRKHKERSKNYFKNVLSFMINSKLFWVKKDKIGPYRSKLQWKK